MKGKLANKGASNPGALAVFIGRKKYGPKKFAALGAMGKKKRSLSNQPSSDLYKNQDEPMGYRKAKKKAMPQRKNHRSMKGSEMLGKGMKKLAGR